MPFRKSAHHTPHTTRLVPPSSSVHQADTIAAAQATGMMLGEFPDVNGVGVLDLADQMLTEEEANARTALQTAIESGGALKLLRAVEQGKEAETSKSSNLLDLNVRSALDLGVGSFTP